VGRILSFRGRIAPGLQERIHLATNDGSKGYRIRKFQIISETPWAGNAEFVAQAFSTDQTGSITSEVDFNKSDLLGVSCFAQSNEWGGTQPDDSIIFDNEIVNQDIYITLTDVLGGTKGANFYIELEEYKLSLPESTYATIKNIRSNKVTVT
jgi:hypothetical protein